MDTTTGDSGEAGYRFVSPARRASAAKMAEVSEEAKIFSKLRLSLDDDGVRVSPRTGHELNEAVPPETQLGCSVPGVSGGAFAISCKKLKLEDGAVRLKLAGGRRVSFRLADGAKVQ